MGDLNSEVCEEEMQICCTTYNLKNLVKEPTCFKTINNPCCIDLILTNKSLSFQNTKVIETGLSDFHRLTITTMKCNFQKQRAKAIIYRNYKYFDNDRLRYDLFLGMNKAGIDNMNCDFETLVISTLDIRAPLKKRYIRANIAPFINKTLCKAIMIRSRLRNRFPKLKTNESRAEYKKQRNYCVSLLRNTKKRFYEKLSPNLIVDNKKFWKQVQPLFSNKSLGGNAINLIEDGNIVSDSTKCAEIINNYFTDAVRESHKTHVKLVDNAIKMFIDHPSILRINTSKDWQTFCFQHTTEISVQNLINNLDTSKSYQKHNNPPKL